MRLEHLILETKRQKKQIKSLDLLKVCYSFSFHWLDQKNITPKELVEGIEILVNSLWLLVDGKKYIPTTKNQ